MRSGCGHLCHGDKSSADHRRRLCRLLGKHNATKRSKIAAPSTVSRKKRDVVLCPSLYVEARNRSAALQKTFGVTPPKLRASKGEAVQNRMSALRIHQRPVEKRGNSHAAWPKLGNAIKIGPKMRKVRAWGMLSSQDIIKCVFSSALICMCV